MWSSLEMPSRGLLSEHHTTWYYFNINKFEETNISIETPSPHAAWTHSEYFENITFLKFKGISIIWAGVVVNKSPSSTYCMVHIMTCNWRQGALIATISNQGLSTRS